MTHRNGSPTLKNQGRNSLLTEAIMNRQILKQQAESMSILELDKAN